MSTYIKNCVWFSFCMLNKYLYDNTGHESPRVRQFSKYCKIAAFIAYRPTSSQMFDSFKTVKGVLPTPILTTCSVHVAIKISGFEQWQICLTIHQVRRCIYSSLYLSYAPKNHPYTLIKPGLEVLLSYKYEFCMLFIKINLFQIIKQPKKMKLLVWKKAE